MQCKKKGVTWWRAVWMSAVGVFIVFGVNYLVVVGPHSIDPAAEIVAFTAAVCLFCVLFMTLGIRFVWGPPRFVAIPPAPLSEETKRTLVRCWRLWVTTVLACSHLLVAFMVLDYFTALGALAWFARATLAYDLLFLFILSRAIGGLIGVQRLRVEGLPLRDTDGGRA